MPEKDVAQDRRLTITLDEKGVIKTVHDPSLTPTLRLTGIKFRSGTSDEDLPLEGEQYEWDLSKYSETGVDLLHLYTSRVQFATNVMGNGKHRNTIGLHVPKLIKLDCGHWGAYKRHREFKGEAGGPQREFGMIENGYVWLCQYDTSSSAASYSAQTIAELKDKRAVVAEMLAKRVQETGAAIRLIYGTRADMRFMTDVGVNRTLYVCFPDLHLPEAWPDLPPHSERHPIPESRVALQKRLRDCQREPHLARGSTLNQSELDEIQDFLETIDPWVRNGRQSPEPNVTYSFKTGYLGFGTTHTFTPRQFLAEKDIVDREFRLRSTWFYGRGPKYKEEVDAGSEDWKDVIYANGNGDATPGIELFDFLLAMRQVKLVDLPNRPVGHGRPPRKLEVVQLGDIYEAWLGREFLYHGFWVRDKDAGALGAYLGIRKQASGMVHALDNYQYRMDEDWYDENAIPPKRRSAKRYVYHHVPKDVMFRRHVVGDMVEASWLNNESELERIWGMPDGELARKQKLLRDRIDSVKNHSLPIPHHQVSKIQAKLNSCGWLDAQYQQRLGILAPNVYVDYYSHGTQRTVAYYRFNNAPARYVHENKLGQREVKWNLAILDLFAELNFLGVYGNHDGYRGDPLLNKKLLPVDRCPGWISHPGVWFEHSHRWDVYNRDGCAFGAGAANLVYYYFNALCNPASGRKEAYLAKQEQKCFQPGAALWFLLANYGRELPWLKCQKGFGGGGPPVHKFGIYVSGHTHTGDLCVVNFRFDYDTEARLEGVDVVTTDSPDTLVAKRTVESQVQTFNARQGGDLSVASNRLAWLKPRPTA